MFAGGQFKPPATRIHAPSVEGEVTIKFFIRSYLGRDGGPYARQSEERAFYFLPCSTCLNEVITDLSLGRKRLRIVDHQGAENWNLGYTSF